MAHGVHHRDRLTIAAEGIVARTRWTEAAKIHRMAMMQRWIVAARFVDATRRRPPGLSRGTSASNNNLSTALGDAVAAITAIVIPADAGIATVAAGLAARAVQPSATGVEHELCGDLEDLVGVGSACRKRNTDTSEDC